MKAKGRTGVGERNAFGRTALGEVVDEQHVHQHRADVEPATVRRETRAVRTEGRGDEADRFVRLGADDFQVGAVVERDEQQLVVGRKSHVMGPAAGGSPPKDFFGFGADSDNFARLAEALGERVPCRLDAVDVEGAAVGGGGHVVKVFADRDGADDFVRWDADHRHVARISVLEVKEFSGACARGSGKG